MKRHFQTIIIGIICCMIAQEAQTQRGISFFVETELDRMLDIAQRENKNIFVDTYTAWCVPCKKLDREFLDIELGNYFNEHFINVKFDMDSPAGKEIHRQYDVFFVPTMLILNPQGELKLKIDQGLISATELLESARQVNEPEVYAHKEISTTEIKDSRGSEEIRPSELIDPSIPKETIAQKNNPINQEKQNVSATADKNGEKILYVLDSQAEVPAFILFEEAYFRLQLMDGSHRSVAKRYLESQDNWLEEKNIRFLHDFVYTTKSEEFGFIINNREAFNLVIGKEKLDRTLDILINKRLYQGVPRPTKEEAIKLFKTRGSLNPEAEALFYLEQRESLPSN